MLEITQYRRVWGCGPRDCRTEWSQSDRERKISYDIPYIWNLKRNDTNELTYRTEKDSQG